MLTDLWLFRREAVTVSCLLLLLLLGGCVEGSGRKWKMILEV